MDLSPSDIITALPNDSILKTALTAIGTTADSMKPTNELFAFVTAYEEVQTVYNVGTLPDMQTVLPASVTNTMSNSDGITRVYRQQLQFKQQYVINDVEPIIVI